MAENTPTNRIANLIFDDEALSITASTISDTDKRKALYDIDVQKKAFEDGLEQLLEEQYSSYRGDILKALLKNVEKNPGQFKGLVNKGNIKEAFRQTVNKVVSEVQQGNNVENQSTTENRTTFNNDTQLNIEEELEKLKLSKEEQKNLDSIFSLISEAKTKEDKEKIVKEKFTGILRQAFVNEEDSIQFDRMVTMLASNIASLSKEDQIVFMNILSKARSVDSLDKLSLEDYDNIMESISKIYIAEHEHFQETEVFSKENIKETTDFANRVIGKTNVRDVEANGNNSTGIPLKEEVFGSQDHNLPDFVALVEAINHDIINSQNTQIMQEENPIMGRVAQALSNTGMDSSTITATLTDMSMRIQDLDEVTPEAYRAMIKEMTEESKESNPEIANILEVLDSMADNAEYMQFIEENQFDLETYVEGMSLKAPEERESSTTIADDRTTDDINLDSLVDVVMASAPDYRSPDMEEQAYNEEDIAKVVSSLVGGVREPEAVQPVIDVEESKPKHFAGNIIQEQVAEQKEPEERKLADYEIEVPDKPKNGFAKLVDRVKGFFQEKFSKKDEQGKLGPGEPQKTVKDGFEITTYDGGGGSLDPLPIRLRSWARRMGQKVMEGVSSVASLGKGNKEADKPINNPIIMSEENQNQQILTDRTNDTIDRQKIIPNPVQMAGKNEATRGVNFKDVLNPDSPMYAGHTRGEVNNIGKAEHNLAKDDMNKAGINGKNPARENPSKSEDSGRGF